MRRGIVRSRQGYLLVHPGSILRDEFLLPLDISQNALARHMGVPPRRVNAIVLGKRAITAETAVLLSDALGVSAHFWMALQADYDIELARERCAKAPARFKRPLAPLPGMCMLDDPKTDHGTARHTTPFASLSKTREP